MVISIKSNVVHYHFDKPITSNNHFDWKPYKNVYLKHKSGKYLTYRKEDDGRLFPVLEDYTGNINQRWYISTSGWGK